ncbi:esterase [Acidihalobacter ferrooxydans]|uniref:Esterase n=1 Tax=Acidihalobacter ferrooxydans TaxID=1765967 RepID=A0A1P8UJN2_9GAMM|nr:esterase [Acidihalobacter ferrooxydans]APZ44036.1 esterase [Acidihalobacter ferrooxydans]
MNAPSLLTLNHSLVVARPDSDPAQLVLLFHGVGDTPQEMLPLAARIADAYPQACVVSVCASRNSDGGGYEWFSTNGITDDNRLERIQAAMPAFLATVRHWQERTGVAPERTALIGFSQSAIMALESTHETSLPATRVVSFGGRFVRLPEPVRDTVTFYLLHGKSDSVIPYGYAVQAAEYLVARDGDVTADILPFVGHEITPEMIDLLLERLQAHIPKRLWQEALRADAPVEPTRGD